MAPHMIVFIGAAAVAGVGLWQRFVQKAPVSSWVNQMWGGLLFLAYILK